MSTTDQKPSSGDEIDLGQLFQKIGYGIRRGWLGTMYLFALIRRVPLENRFSFLGIVGVSVSLAIAYSILLKKSYYESTLILNSSYLNKRLVDNSIEKIDALANEQDKDGLARLFNIPDSLADNIIGFEAKPLIIEADVIQLELLKEQLRSAEGADEAVIEDVLRRIEIENRHSFEITIRTLNPTIIPNLQDALVGYFRNTDYVKRRIEINKLNLEQRRAKLMNDLQKMDSLKVVIYANYKSMAEQARSGSNNVILSDRAVTSPVEIFNQDLALYNDLQEINSQLYLQPDFEVVDGFTEFSEPASPSTVKMVLLALAIGIVIAYLDVAIRSFNSYLASLDKT
jgi:hypothetical protein